jgi:hypothetical protein
MNSMSEEVRQVLQRFQDGYTARDLAKLDEFMALFHRSDDIELIGIGASVRGGNEWFQGIDAIREIVESDWVYWGDVFIDVDGAKITVHGDVAWLSTSGTLTQTDTFTKALPLYLNQMKELLEDETSDPDARMMEATHFGLRRLRERQKGVGFAWPFVLTAVLVRTHNAWCFHTIHWSMPVD